MRRVLLFVVLCIAASIAHAAFTISRTSSATFYTDTSVTPNITCSYESFSVTSSSAVTDAWARASSFTGVLGLGGSDDGIQNLGAFSAGQTKYAFFYVCSNFTGGTSSGGFDVAVYDRNPALAGAVTLGGPGTFSFTVDNTLIQAATNQVTTIFAGPNPATIGGIVTMTVEGDTGTIGNAPGPNGPLSFTPAAYSSWRADAYELFASNISFSGGNSGSYDNQLVIPSLAGGSNTHYVATYYFRAMGGTTTSTELSPLVDIASGTQMKHTDTTKGAYGSGLLPIEPASNSLLLAKLVSAATLPAQGGTVTYTLRVSNGSGSPVSLDDFVDTLPAGATYVSNSSTFGGVAIANPYVSGQVLTWNAPFTVPAGGSIDLVFQATLPATPNLYTNGAVAHIGSTVIDATYSTSDNVPATAATRVLLAPTVAKSFAPVATAMNGTSTLTLTFTNPNGTVALTGLAIADTYPAGLVNAATPSAATTCTGATITGGAAGGNTIGITGGSIPAGASCTLTVSVTSSAAATYANTTGTVSSTNGGTGTTASASVTFTTKPTLAKTFTPAVVPLGTVSHVAITVTNNNTVSLTALAFSDTLPAGMAIAATPNLSNTCGGTVTGATAGSTSVSLSAGGIALPTLTCQVAFDVIASPAGVHANTTSGASSTETGAAGPASNTATLTVMSAPAVSKAFSVASMGRGQAATLTITLANTNGTDIAGAAFTDTYPANLVNASTPAEATTCAGGTVTAVAGGGSVALSGATLPANGSCTVTVNVTSNTAATYTNTIAAGAVTAANAPASTAAASAQIIVNNTPTIAKSFSTNLASGVTTMTLAITNNATSGGVSALAFTDNFPAGLVVAAAPAMQNNCGGTVTGATGGSTSLGLSGGAIATPGTTCQLSVSVISNVQGVYNNTTTGVSSSLGTGSPSNTATYIAPALTKGFSPNTMGVGDASRLTLTISNPSPTTALTGVAFTDNYPSNLINTTSPSVTNTCGGTVTGGVASGNNIGLTGGSLAPGASCSISVNVAATAVASYYNQTGNVVSSQGVGVNGADTLYITTKPTITKSFSPAAITVGTASTLTLTVENNNGSNSIGNLAFSDPFPAGLAVAATPALTNTCGGTVSGATAGSTSVSLAGGALAAGARCTITVAVTSATAGSYANQANGATSTETGATPGPRSNIAVLTANLAAPTVAKSFAASPVGINTDTAMTITLTNPNTSAITGVNFTDTYPSGLVNSGTPNVTSTCSGSATAAAGGNSLALVGGTIPASGSCSVTVSVQSASANTYVNSTGAVTAANANSGASASATLVVLAPLTVTKSFAPSTVGPNVATVMTIRLANPNSIAATGAAFTDGYPAGLANTATPAGATTCAGGTVTAAANASSVSFSGGTVPASGNCTITVNVSASAAGTYTNTLVPGAVTTTNAGSNSAAGSATLTVLAPLTVTKSFSPASIGTGDTSVMTITLANPNAVVVTGIALADSYPAGLVNTANANAQASACAAGVTSPNNATSLTMTGGSLPANGSCTITVNVTSATAGSYVNSTGPVTTTNAGTAAAVSGTLAALAHPSIAKAFSPSQVPVNGTSTLTLTLANANATAITGVAFTDTYPAGLKNAATPAASSTCAGASVTAAAGSGSIAVTGATIPANGTCTVQVAVTPTTTGSFANTVAAGAVTSANAGASTAAATGTLTALAPLTVAKSFNLATVGTGVSSVLAVTLTNPNGVAVTGAAFTDAYPAGLANTATPNGATSCAAGSVTAAASGTSLALSGGTVPAGGSCTVTVSVSAASAGSYANTLATGAVTATNAGPNAAPASATLTVLAPLTVAKSFSPATVGTGDASVMTVTLTNGNATAVNGVAFTDAYPAGLVNTATANAQTTCGGAVTAANNGNSAALSGGTVPANGSCTVTVNVTSATPGTYVNSTGAVTTTNAGTAAAAGGTLTVLAHPTVAKSFGPAQVGVNGTSTLTFTLGNTNAVDITGVAFTDNYPMGLQNTATPSASSTCPGAVISVSGGGTSLGISSATIPANGSCTVQVNVTPTTTGSLANTLAAGALTSANAGASTVAATATLASLAPLTVAKAFAPSTAGPGVPSVLTVTLTNPNALAVTGVAFTDAYPAGLANTATPNGATTCAAGTVTASANGTTFTFSGGTVPANGSCTVTINVAAAPGSYTNTLAAGDVSTTNAGVNAAPASATLTVLASIAVAKTFSPPSIGTGDASVMTIAFTNGNATAVTGVAFTDTYPAGLANTAAALAATTCGGSVTGANNGTSLALSGGTVPANGSCTVTVNVTSAAAGSYVNSTGPIATTNDGTVAAASGTLTVMAHPAVTKDFNPTLTGVNGTSTLTFTLANSNASAIAGVAFTDNYPAGLQNAATPAASSTCAGASITAAAAGTSIAVTGATIPANGSCTVQVTVTPTTTGSFANTLAAGALTSANAGASTAAASATLTAQSQPTATKAFVPANIATNGTSVLTITIANPNPTGLTGVAFTDSYPAGLVNTGTPSAAISGAGCSGTVSASAGGASLALSGGVVPASSSCTITVNVTANTPGSYVNSTGAIATANAGTGAAASGTLRVFTAPTVTKSFAPTFVPTGGSSTLTIVVTNPAANPANLTGAAISDTYPAGLLNNAAGSVSCSAGSATLTGGANGGTSVGFTGATIPPGATCTITQSVATTANVTNTTSTATSNEAPAGAAASASLSTSATPSIAKAFSPDTVALGGTSTLTFTITNPNPIALTGGAFTDTLSGMQVDATGAAGGTCAGAGGNTFTAGQASLAFTGISVPASQACTVTVVVRGTTVGANPNTASGFSSNQAPTSAVSNTATLTVTATAPTITKAFSVSPIDPGAASALTVTIANGNASPVAITSVTDTLPAGMTVAAIPNIANSCSGGTVANTPGSVTLTGGTVPAGGSCAFSIDVTSSTAGAALVNTIPAGALTTSAGSNAVAASATLNVRPSADLSITKTTPATVASGGAVTYTIVVSNAGPSAANGAQFSDNVPAAVTGVAAACGAVTGGAACGTVNVAGNAVTSTITTLPAGGSVTFTVTGTAPATGTFTNSASVITPAGVSDPTDPGRTGAGNNTASANTTVVAPDLRITKGHTGSFSVGVNGTYSITVDNTLGTAATSGTITVTDTLPAGLAYVSATGTGWTCSGSGQSATCTTNAVIAAGASNPNAIALTVSVGSAAVGTVTNTAAVSGGGEPAANNGNNAAFDPTLVVSAATNSFAPDNAQAGMPGTSLSYGHVFNAGSAGSVSFSLATVTTPPTAGWTQQVYRDTDCNGVLGAAEAASLLTGAIAVSAGDTVCIIVRDNIPANAAYNSQNVITVTATFTGGLTYTRQDVTTVGAAGGAGLTLSKAVRNVTLGTAAGTSNTARPNDVLEYTITYTNTSATALSSIVITDSTPSYTTFQSATCGAPLPASITGCTVTTAPAAGSTGSIVWTLGGSLLSSNTGTVIFTVRVLP